MKSDLTVPMLRLGSLLEDERVAIQIACEAGTPEGKNWIEKLRRFASLYGRNLKSEAPARFGGETSAHLSWIADCLLAGALHTLDCSSAPVDSATLNAALYVLDARPDPVQEIRATKQITDLAAWLAKTGVNPPGTPALGFDVQAAPAIWAKEAKTADPVVIISPNPFSLGSLSVLEMCLSFGIPVEAILLRRFTLSRLAQEWHRDGPRLLRKIWRKLVLKTDENADATKVSLRALADALMPPHSDIRKRAAEMDIPVIKVAEFDDAHAEIKKRSPKIAIFTGGGLIKKPLIDCFGVGIINVHMGVLPQYKGMDVVQAPIIDGAFDAIGLTAHLMVPALDAGPIISSIQASSDHYATLGALRNELSALSPIMAIDAAMALSSGRAELIQQPNAGRHYYFVHPRLLAILEKTMADRHERVTGENAIHSKTDVFFEALKDLPRNS
jgi:folate-dependent phosphoribosylglycinamide formyltransferase PurN